MSGSIAAASIRATSAAQVIRDIASLPGLRFRGLLSHAGHGYHAGSDSEMARSRAPRRRCCAISRRSRACDARKSASAPRRPRGILCREEGLTEIRPGNYAYFDRTQVGLGVGQRGTTAR